MATFTHLSLALALTGLAGCAGFGATTSSPTAASALALNPASSKPATSNPAPAQPIGPAAASPAVVPPAAASTAGQPTPPTNAAAAPDPAEAEKAARIAALPKQALTPGMLFQFLVAEIAGQRGQISVAKTAYLDLTRQTRDPRIAERAAEISVFARDPEAALTATEIWSASDPASERARQTLVALHLSQGDTARAEPELRNMLKEDAPGVFMNLPALLAKTRNPEAGFALTQKLAADFPKLPEAWFALGQIGAQTGHFDVALKALTEAEKLRPDWQPMALLRAQLLSRTSRSDALAYLKSFVERHPDAREARLGYARLLVSSNQTDAARIEFQRLVTDFPDNAEIGLSAALLTLQAGDAPAAEKLLLQTLANRPRDPDPVYYYLGLAAEEQKDSARALDWHAKVGPGNYEVQARTRQAVLLARTGKLDEARQILKATSGRNDEERVRLIQTEAELLREARDPVAAYKTLTEGLARYPDSTELLYDRAMAAEKIDRLDVLEVDLRRLIELTPDNAQAYNALGYTLADRTPRLAEALQLLEQAIKLAPDDPFILDSYGWAQYRAGNLPRAQEFIERAYKARPDPEIAAHLGEVMWARGRQGEATALWKLSLQAHPQNELLLQTLRRFPQ